MKIYIDILNGIGAYAMPAHRKAPIAPRGEIALAARALGVTREHLSRVLHGHRQSRSLTSRYTALAQSGTHP